MQVLQTFISITEKKKLLEIACNAICFCQALLKPEIYCKRTADSVISVAFYSDVDRLLYRDFPGSILNKQFTQSRSCLFLMQICYVAHFEWS